MGPTCEESITEEALKSPWPDEEEVSWRFSAGTLTLVALLSVCIGSTLSRIWAFVPGSGAPCTAELSATGVGVLWFRGPGGLVGAAVTSCGTGSLGRVSGTIGGACSL